MKLPIRSLLFMALTLTVSGLPILAQTSPERQALIQPFFDAKFGVFIHFGLYSVPEGEWKGGKHYGEWFQRETKMPYEEYAKFAPQFNPTKFNAREWVQNVKDAGIKYIVVTTKHHDGFAMYNTKMTDWNVIQKTPWARDPMPDLAAACRELGVMLCFYYSVPDWYQTDFPQRYSQRPDFRFHGRPDPNANLDKYVEYMKAQVREILTQYGPIGALWFDDGGAFRGDPMAKLIHAQEIIDLVHELQPACAIDDRLGLPADYGTPEQWIPAGKQARPFEACMSLNKHWGYNKHDHDWKSPLTVIRQLADTVGKGGNYLLGIGAMGDGTFPPPECRPILADIGAWLRVNGDAIYGAKAGLRTPWHHGVTTTKDDKIYLHVFNWPANGQLKVPVANQARRAFLLADPQRQPLTVSAGERGVTVSVPAAMPDPIDTVIVLEVEDAANLVELPDAANLAFRKPVTVSSEWPGRANLVKAHITDGNFDTTWAAEEAARSAWVAVDLEAEYEVGAITLGDGRFKRTTAFDVEAKIGGEWQRIANGATIGDRLELPLAPAVKAQHFRLNIRQASDTPTLSEFQLHEK